MKSEAKTETCQICKRQFPVQSVVPGAVVRPPIVELIRKDHADWSPDGYICEPDLNHFRTEYVEDVLESEKGELSQLDQEVVRSFREHELLAEDLNAQFERQLTLGERVADKVAEFGGSWMFITCFGIVMLAWIGINSHLALTHPFDPFPYILLNLVLSCLAAIQAPVIMMSQNRQEDKDRLRAEHDYRVNLKAELEIRHLNAKLDLLLNHQWHHLIEIQQLQTDLMAELVRQKHH